MHRVPISEDDLRWAYEHSGAKGPLYPSESSAAPAYTPALTQTSASSPHNTLTTTTSPQKCTACQDQITTQDGVTKVPCGHLYHPECLLMLVEVAMRTPSQFPPHCCRQPISPVLVRALLSSEQWDTFERLQFEHSTPRPLYCASRRCSRFLGSRSDRIPVQVSTCDSPRCSTRTCARCTVRLSRHETAEKHVCTHDPEQAAVLRLGITQGWVRCPGCQQLVERNGGCPHMTCLCGTEFCYACGQRFRACVCGQRPPPRPAALAVPLALLAPARLPALPPAPTITHTARPRRDLPVLPERLVELPIELLSFAARTRDEGHRRPARSAVRRPGMIPTSAAPVRLLRFAPDDFYSSAAVTQATRISSRASDSRTLVGDPFEEERPSAGPAMSGVPVTHPSIASGSAHRRRDALGSSSQHSPAPTRQVPPSLDGHHSLAAPMQATPMLPPNAKPAPDSEDRMPVDDSEDEQALLVQPHRPLSRTPARRQRTVGEGLWRPGEDILHWMEVSPTSSIAPDAGDRTLVEDTQRGQPRNGSARWSMRPFASSSTSTVGPKYTFEWR